jgi:exonuclease VII small subunit
MILMNVIQDIVEYKTKKQMKATLEQHETCIEIMCAIKYFNQRIETTKQAIKGMYDFQDIIKKYENKIDTYYKCIERLEQRHQRIIKQMI